MNTIKDIVDIMALIANEEYGIQSDIFKNKVNELIKNSPETSGICSWETHLKTNKIDGTGTEYISEIYHYICFKHPDHYVITETLLVYITFSADPCEDNPNEYDFNIYVNVSSVYGDKFLSTNFHSSLKMLVYEFIYDELIVDDLIGC